MAASDWTESAQEIDSEADVPQGFHDGIEERMPPLSLIRGFAREEGNGLQFKGFLKELKAVFVALEDA